LSYKSPATLISEICAIAPIAWYFTPTYVTFAGSRVTCIKINAMNMQRNNLVRLILAYAALRDLAPEYLCRLSDINFTRISNNQNVLISDKQFDDLWVNAASLSGDDLFGLHFGESLQLSALGTVGQIIQSANTVGDALLQAASLLRLITDIFWMEVVFQKNKIRIGLHPDTVKSKRPSLAFRHQIDATMIFILHEMDGILLKKIRPETVKMPGKNISNPEEYHRLLRIRHITNSTEYLMVFPGEYRDLPIITANYSLQRLLRERLELELQPKENCLQNKIENYIKTNGYLGIPSLEEIAANFNTSPRSLQRKLQEEGVSYQQLAASYRKNMALYYLESGIYPIKEISYMLGYNELSSFSKAFKKWTGKTPNHFQNTTDSSLASSDRLIG
jgi:AraC-like DNA-binding protein